MYKVKIQTQNGTEQEVICQENQTLLDAAFGQGVDIKYACKGGGCGLCKIKVSEGSFERGKSSKAVLPDSERERNYSLACKTYPKSDLSVVV